MNAGWTVFETDGKNKRMLLGFSVTAKGRLNVTYRFNKN